MAFEGRTCKFVIVIDKLCAVCVSTTSLTQPIPPSGAAADTKAAAEASPYVEALTGKG